MDTVEYLPLQGDEIRLITLERERANGVLRCSMRHAPLSPDTQFHALSYVWGSPDDKRTILVNDRKLEVTRNLYDFLNQLWQDEDLFRRKRAKAREDLEKPADLEEHTGPLLWWIDAICINQMDVDERSVQVPRMRELYSSAKQVWIWFGLPEAIFYRDRGDFSTLRLALSNYFSLNESSKNREPMPVRLFNAFFNGTSTIVARLVHSRMEHDGSHASDPDTVSSVPELDVIGEMLRAGISENDIREAAGFPPLSNVAPDMKTAYFQQLVRGQGREQLEQKFYNQVISELAQLLQSDWFDRTWVKQEFLLGRKPPIAVIGDYTVYMSHLWGCGQNIFSDRSVWPTTRSPRVKALFPKFNKLDILFSAYSEKHYGIETGFVTFPGITPEAKLVATLRNFSRKLSTVPHDHIYGMLGFWDIHLPDHLTPNYRLPFERVCQDFAIHFLRCTQDLKVIEAHKSELTGCPSWVPDFRYLSDNLIHASRWTIGEVQISEDNKRLAVQGIRMGAIVACNCSFPPGSDPCEQLRYIDEVILSGAALLTDVPLSEVFLKWLQSRVDMEVLPRSIIKDIKSMDQLIDEYLSSCQSIPPQVVANMPHMDEADYSFLYQIQCPNPGLVHFIALITTRSRYGLIDTGEIGLCALKSHSDLMVDRYGIDDTVWALKGCARLSVLRSGDGGYEYSGTFLVNPPECDYNNEEHRKQAGNQYVLDEEFFSGKVLDRITLL